MKYLELANAFERIGTTTKRSEMTAYLATAFKRANPEEARIIAYLMQGRLGPPYAAPNLGINERRLAEAIAQVAGKKIEKVWSLYQDMGDFGLVAEKLLPEQGQRLTIQAIYDRLLEIAQTTGTGSAEKKLGHLVQLLSQLGKIEARYLARIAQGKLRLGVGDAMLMEGLSRSLSKPELRDAIEHAYTFSSDLGLVANVSMTEGEKGLEKVRPTPGRPILPALAQRVPSPAAAVTRLGRLIVEPKYDGLRLQLHKDGHRIWLFTRRLEDISGALPSLADAAKDQIQASKVILDGEVIGYDQKTKRFLPFQETVRRKRKHQVEEMSFLYPVRYYSFDILSLDRQDLTSKPLLERAQKLAQVIKEKPEGPIFKTPQIETESVDELVEILDQMLSKQLEGVVVKRPDAPYHAGGRDFNWIKIKREHTGLTQDTYDLVVVGYFKGRGKRSRLGVGSLLCAVYEPSNARFRTVTRLGSGLSDEEWKEFRKKLDNTSIPSKPPQVDSLIEPDVWVDPRFVIEVAAAEITRSPRHTCGKVAQEKGYSLRFPRMLQFRFDRRSDDATTEREIVELYQTSVGQEVGKDG
jgi:DNA ligase 1